MICHKQLFFLEREVNAMGFDMEYILGENRDLGDAYDDLIWEADQWFDKEFGASEESDFFYEYSTPPLRVKGMRQTKLLKSLIKKYGLEEFYLEPLARELRDFLFKEGYAEQKEGQPTKVPTEKGKQIGLYMKDGMTKDGKPFSSMVFDQSAQDMVARKIPEFVKYIDAVSGGKYRPPRPALPKNIISGIFWGKKVFFNRNFADHTFTDDEVKRLLEGKLIPISYTDKNWVKRSGIGHLQCVPRNGKTYCQFIMSRFADYKYNYGPEDVKGIDYEPGC